MFKKNHILCLFLISFVLGFFIFHSQSEINISERELASIQQININNMNFLNSEALQKDLHKKVRIYSLSENKIIALEGFSSQICKTFSSIELYFEAYGILVSGSTPQFKISTDCVPGQDPAEIAVIKIPVAQLLSEKARNAEFKYSNHRETFELINSDEWARTWLLSQITFKSQQQTKTIQVHHDRSAQSQPIVLEF